MSSLAMWSTWSALWLGCLGFPLPGHSEPVNIKEHADTVTALAFSPDGNWVASGSADHTVKLCHSNSGDCAATLQLGAPALTLTFSPNGKGLAAGTADDAIHVWSTASGNLLWSCTGNGGGARAPTTPCITFSPDTRLVASGHRGGVVSVYDLKTRTQKTLTIEPRGSVTAIAFSADGTQLATASAIRGGPRQITVWTLEGDAAPRQFPIADLAEFLAFAAGDKLLLYGLRDGIVACINADDGKERAHLRYEGQCRALALSARRGRLLIVGEDELRIIDIFRPSGKKIGRSCGPFTAAAVYPGNFAALVALAKGDEIVTVRNLPYRTLDDMSAQDIDRQLESLASREASLQEDIRQLDNTRRAGRLQKSPPDMSASLRAQQLSIMLHRVQRTMSELRGIKTRKASKAKAGQPAPPATAGWDFTNLGPADLVAAGEIEPSLDAEVPGEVPAVVEPDIDDNQAEPANAGEAIDDEDDPGHESNLEPESP